MICCHGQADCKNNLFQEITYEDVLNYANDFINGTDEFIILTVKKEYDDITDAEFNSHIHKLHNKYNIIELNSINVPISNVKGHVCVINRQINDLNRQDEFYVMYLKDKKMLFKNALEDDNIQLNASNVYLFPRLYAYLMNGFVKKEIIKSSNPQWFMIDFINPKLIKTIINKNM